MHTTAFTKITGRYQLVVVHIIYTKYKIYIKYKIYTKYKIYKSYKQDI